METAIIDAVNSTLHEIRYIYQITYVSIPGASVLVRYVQNSYQNDPFRILLELLLVIFAFRYLTSKKYAPDSRDLALSENEIEGLVNEWQPDALVPQLSPVEKMDIDVQPVINNASGQLVRLVGDGREYVNLSSCDFLGLLQHPEILNSAKTALRKHGVGACGPPGFYGTIDVHLDLEQKLAKFIGTEEAIIYSQNFAAVSSVLPAFSKRGDILICDESINFALQKGVQISRSSIYYYKHNDMQDLERLLDRISSEAKNSKKPLNRRFIVFEGVSQYYGDICPLPRILELKRKYKFRLIADESFSFGILGRKGAGITDYFNIDPKDVDIIVSSMANSLGSNGGFCAGSREVIDHQRLSGVAYCFSAALPALLASAAINALEILERDKDVILPQLRKNISFFRSAVADNLKHASLTGDNDSPLLHIRLDSVYGTREDEETFLQSVLEELLKDGFLATRAKYVVSQEIHAPKPSIRICISANHQQKDLVRAAKSLQKAFKTVAKTRK